MYRWKVSWNTSRDSFGGGDAYVSSETPLGDNSVRVQSPKRVSPIWHGRTFRVVLRSTRPRVSLWVKQNVNKEYLDEKNKNAKSERISLICLSPTIPALPFSLSLSLFSLPPSLSFISPSDSWFIEASKQHNRAFVNDDVRVVDVNTEVISMTRVSILTTETGRKFRVSFFFSFFF